MKEQCFIWETEDSTLFYDPQETVRFRIEEEHWFDQNPSGPSDKDDGIKTSPFTITASMEDAGLGPCLWWDGDDE